MHVLHKGNKLKFNQDDVGNFALQWVDQGLAVKARVVWIKNITARKHLFGFEFEDINPSTVTGINQLRRLATDSLTVGAGLLHDQGASD